MELSDDSGWSFFTKQRQRLLAALIHVLFFLLGLLAAFLVWFDATHATPIYEWFFSQFLPCLPYFVIMKMLVFWRKGLLRAGWRFSGIRDILDIFIALWWFVVITCGSLMIFVWVPKKFAGSVTPFIGDYFGLFPKGVLVLDFLMTFFLVCGARLAYRIYREEFRAADAAGVRRVLIVGAGDAGESVIREMRRMIPQKYDVVGLVDDDSQKQNIIINGVPVLGTTDQIQAICKENDINEIVIAMPSASQKQLRRVIDLCSGTKLRVQALPGIGDLIDGRVTVSQIKELSIDDLLGRKVAQLDHHAISLFIRDRVVLVTGAGGSIGSQMCRQIGEYSPGKLILVEQAENSLFEIQNELTESFKDLNLVACLCDIYDRQRVMDIWRTHRPEVVIHAAAHKHVPMMELNPTEAVKNNILGTRNIADASAEFGTAAFVMISTDKAVNPSSIMGASKRVAEIYTQALGSRGGATKFMSVRFGNVLGSAGSVVPIFKKQIARGGPVKVTHPEMTRYFMTIPEASQLVLQASSTGKGGQIFLLDMGEPVKIVDLARQMIVLSGFRPGDDIDIAFTGVRPGEKLFEELRTSGEDIQPTVHPSVMIWQHRPVEWPIVQNAYEQFEKLVNNATRQQIVDAIRRLVPEYSPQNPPTDAK